MADSIKISELNNYEGGKLQANTIQTSSFSTMEISEATKILRHALMTDKNLYSGLAASIESALRESTVVWEEWEYTETARKIADRIIGKE